MRVRVCVCVCSGPCQLCQPITAECWHQWRCVQSLRALCGCTAAARLAPTKTPSPSPPSTIKNGWDTHTHTHTHTQACTDLWLSHWQYMSSGPCWCVTTLTGMNMFVSLHTECLSINHLSLCVTGSDWNFTAAGIKMCSHSNSSWG